MPYKPGDRVLCKCAGKVSRLEGVAGKWMPGRVKQDHGDEIAVDLDHRNSEVAESFSFGLVGRFPRASIRPQT